MIALTATLALAFLLTLALLVIQRAGYDDELARRKRAEADVAAMDADWQAGFRDAWAKGYAAAEQVRAAGIEPVVVDLSDLDDAVTVDDVLRGWGR